MILENTIQVSREIQASSSSIFAILRDPQKHKNFDGSQMITGSLTSQLLEKIGDRFTMTMNRNGDSYLMINIVADFKLDCRISWTPAPGDTSRSEGHKEENIGKPAGYKWGYLLEAIDLERTKVTEIFEFGPLTAKNFEDGGKWINTRNTVEESMQNTLNLIARML